MRKTKKPDRFERVVLKATYPDMCVDKDAVIKLLRKEHAWVVRMIRRTAAEEGTLRGYCARHGVHTSTLSNMLHGRNRWTPRVLRLLGLEHVRIVARVEGAAVELVRAPGGRPYRPMWRLGDWPKGMIG